MGVVLVYVVIFENGEYLSIEFVQFKFVFDKYDFNICVILVMYFQDKYDIFEVLNQQVCQLFYFFQIGVGEVYYCIREYRVN